MSHTVLHNKYALMNNADIVPSLAKITLYSSEDRIKHLCEFVITNCDNSMTETNRE